MQLPRRQKLRRMTAPALRVCPTGGQIAFVWHASCMDKCTGKRIQDYHDKGEAMSQKNVDSSAVKDPQEWVTGEEPMTGAQDSYLHTLAREAGEEVKEDL